MEDNEMGRQETMMCRGMGGTATICRNVNIIRPSPLVPTTEDEEARDRRTEVMMRKGMRGNGYHPAAA